MPRSGSPRHFQGTGAPHHLQDRERVVRHHYTAHGGKHQIISYVALPGSCKRIAGMTIYVATIANVNSKLINGRMSDGKLLETIRTCPHIEQHTQRVRSVLADHGKDAIDPQDPKGRSYYNVSRLTVPALLPAVDCPVGTLRKNLPIGFHNGTYVYDVDQDVDPSDIPIMLTDMAKWPHTVLAARSISGQAVWASVMGPKACTIGEYTHFHTEIRGMLPESVRRHASKGQHDLGRSRFLAHSPDAVRGKSVPIEGLTAATHGEAPKGGSAGAGFPPPLTADEPITFAERRDHRDWVSDRISGYLASIDLLPGDSYGTWTLAGIALVALEIEFMSEGLTFDGAGIFVEWTVSKAHPPSTKPGRATDQYADLRRRYDPFREGAILDGADRIVQLARAARQGKDPGQSGAGPSRGSAGRFRDEGGEESGEGRPSPGHGRILIAAGKNSLGLLAALGHLGWDIRINIRSAAAEIKPIRKSTEVQARDWTDIAPQAPDGWVTVEDPVRDWLSERIAERCEYRSGNGQVYALSFDPAAFRRSVSALSLDRSVDPFRDYLKRLRDPVPDPDIWVRLFTEAFGVDPGDYSQQYLAHAGRLMVIPAVARAFKPGCESSTLLTLIGPEGYGKSSAFQFLFEEKWRDLWFTDNFSCRMLRDDDDVVEHTRGRVLVEIADMAGLTATEAGALKSGLSRQSENNVRLVWRENPSNYRRRFSFVGSANDEGTGVLPLAGDHRRFWPVRIPRGERTRTESGKRVQDWVFRHREQLWVRGMCEFGELGIASYLEKGILVTEHEAEVDQSRTTGAGIDGLVERITALDPKWLRGKDGEGRTLADLLTKIEVWQKTGPDREDVPIGLAEVEARLAVSLYWEADFDGSRGTADWTRLGARPRPACGQAGHAVDSSQVIYRPPGHTWTYLTWEAK